MCLHVLKPARLQNNAAPAVFTSMAAATAPCSCHVLRPADCHDFDRPRGPTRTNPAPQNTLTALAQSEIEGLKALSIACS